MTSSIGFTLFNLGCAVLLYVLIFRAHKNKKLEITLISGPVTKVEKIVLTGKGLAVAIIGWAISAALFTFSGLRALDVHTNMEANTFMTFISLVIAIFTMLIAGYITTHNND